MAIISNFSGNLGNHLFTYILTRTIAEKNRLPFGFNPKPEFDYLNGKSQLDMLFNLDYGKVQTCSYYELPKGYDSYIEKFQDYGDRRFYFYDRDLCNIDDNTKLFISCGQDARYFDREKVRSWLEINNKIFPNNFTFDLPIWDHNFVIINVRGGEYKGIKELCLGKDYYTNAVRKMQEQTENCKFAVITDDIEYSKSILPYPAYHYSIALDYWIIQNARNLILSNSSFAIIPAWLNESENIIAPKFWARYNTETGWTSSDVWTFGFNFLGKEGNLEKYV